MLGSVRIYGVAIKSIDRCPDLFKSFLSDSSKKRKEGIKEYVI